LNKWIVIAFISYGAFNWYQNNNDTANVFSYGEPHNELIMYSLTTCGYCKKKVKQLNNKKIAFTEYFIDVDVQRKEELYAKLEKSGYPSRSIGMPTFDVHGSMLPNNPNMKMIKAALLNTELNQDL
jgi:glutaredoxin